MEPMIHLFASFLFSSIRAFPVSTFIRHRVHKQTKNQESKINQLRVWALSQLELMVVQGILLESKRVRICTAVLVQHHKKLPLNGGEGIIIQNDFT